MQTDYFPITNAQAVFLNFTETPHHDVLAEWIYFDEPVDIPCLQATLHFLVDTHDNLRLEFRKTENRWEQRILPPGSISPHFTLVEAETLSAETYLAQLQAIPRSALSSLTLSQAPLFRVILLKGSPEFRDALFIVMHHALGDAVTQRLLGTIFLKAYFNRTHGRLMPIPKQTPSFAHYCDWLVQRSQSQEFRSNLSHWTAFQGKPTLHIASDFPKSDDPVLRIGNYNTWEMEMPALAIDSTLKQCLRQYKLLPDRVLFAVYLRALSQVQGDGLLPSWFMENGRALHVPGMNLAQLAGCLVYCPMLFIDLNTEMPIEEWMLYVNGVVAEGSPQGLDFSVAYYCDWDFPEDTQSMVGNVKSLPFPEIFFNFTGRSAPAGHSFPVEIKAIHGAAVRGPTVRRRYGVACVLWTDGGSYYWDFFYHRQFYSESWIHAFGEAIRQTCHELCDRLQ